MVVKVIYLVSCRFDGGGTASINMRAPDNQLDALNFVIKFPI